jgi:hypothetical protein
MIKKIDFSSHSSLLRDVGRSPAHMAGPLIQIAIDDFGRIERKGNRAFPTLLMFARIVRS